MGSNPPTWAFASASVRYNGMECDTLQSNVAVPMRNRPESPPQKKQKKPPDSDDSLCPAAHDGGRSIPTNVLSIKQVASFLLYVLTGPILIPIPMTSYMEGKGDLAWNNYAEDGDLSEMVQRLGPEIARFGEAE